MNQVNANNLAESLKAFQPNIFFGSASFEDRCFSVVDKINSISLKEIYVCRNIDFEDDSILENSILFKEKINTSGSNFIDLKAGDPKFSFFELNESINQIFQGNSKSILFDITTFTHEALLIATKIMFSKRRPEDKIIVCYNGAKSYSQKEKNIEEKWLTKGVKEIRSILGYPGFFDPSQKNHLIILFGFEKERTLKLIEKYEYDLVSLAYGSSDGSISEEHQSINESRHKEVLALNSNAQIFNISLRNPYSAKKEILDFVSQYSSFNTVIAPMNNKLSTFGAGLAAIENPNIQLCYLQAQKYNVSGYSEAGDQFHVFKI